MAIVGETETAYQWRGPNGIVLLAKAEYEVSGGTIRLKRRPVPPTPEPPPAAAPRRRPEVISPVIDADPDLPPGTVRGR